MGEDALAPGLRDELITLELAELLEAVDANRIDAEDVPARVALERLGRHLLRVARRMRGPNDRNDVREAAALVNSAIEALGESFAGDKVGGISAGSEGTAPGVRWAVRWCVARSPSHSAHGE